MGVGGGRVGGSAHAPPPAGRFTLEPHPAPATDPSAASAIAAAFPALAGAPALRLTACPPNTGTPDPPTPLRVGVVLSGGMAPGGHNVIAGLHDYMAARHPASALIGFLGGPAGVVKCRYTLIDAETVLAFRNQGGFHMLQSGRDKIESKEDLDAAADTARSLNLDGLLVIGGDDSATNAAVLAQHFRAAGLKTACISAPKTVDGDLKLAGAVPTSFGFDTACKMYAEAVGNIALDAKSGGKYWCVEGRGGEGEGRARPPRARARAPTPSPSPPRHFIRVMGRAASHVALEVALQTRPNVALVSEEVKARGMKLADVVREVADVVVARAAAGMPYGVAVLPEGLIEFIDDVGALIRALNDAMAADGAPAAGDAAAVAAALAPHHRSVFELLPPTLRAELLLERDPHGNVQVSRIETERLLAGLVCADVAARGLKPPAVICHFLGYEGRCALPSNFDAAYTATLGHAAGALLARGATGVIVSVTGLDRPAADWCVGGFPLASLLTVERRKGKDKLVVRKALVELDGAPFAALAAARAGWAAADCYRVPGPLQFSGVGARTGTMTLAAELGVDCVVTH